MSLDPNPLHWSPDLKTVSAAMMIAATIIGSSWKAADYLGNKLYKFAEIQTTILQQLKDVQQRQVDGKVELSNTIKNESAAREKSLVDLKGELSPRIHNLETAVGAAITEAAGAKQRADDMKEDLKELKGLAHQTLNVTESHDADIKATRNAVAPKTTTPH